VRAGARVLGITSSFTEEALREAGASWIVSDLACAPFPWELVVPPAAEDLSRRRL
jgi:hypothetical protein